MDTKQILKDLQAEITKQAESATRHEAYRVIISAEQLNSWSAMIEEVLNND